jgi:NAD(P)H-flavin reductase
MLLFWGVTDALDFYELDVISEWLEHAANFDCVLAATRWPSTSGVPERATSFIGYVADAIEAHGIALSGYDAYVAGPRESITTSATALRRRGVTDDRIVADSFGLTSPTGSSVVNEIQEEQR